MSDFAEPPTSFRLGHLPVTVLAHASERVLGRLHRRPRQRLRPLRRFVPGLRLRPRDDLVELRTEVEVTHLAALCAELLAKLLRRIRLAEHDAVVALSLLLRDEPLGHVGLHPLDRPLERILPAATPRGAVDEQVAGLDRNVVAL